MVPGRGGFGSSGAARALAVFLVHCAVSLRPAHAFFAAPCGHWPCAAPTRALALRAHWTVWHAPRHLPRAARPCRPLAAPVLGLEGGAPAPARDRGVFAGRTLLCAKRGRGASAGRRGAQRGGSRGGRRGGGDADDDDEETITTFLSCPACFADK